MTHVFFCAAPVRGYFAALPACSESGGQSPVTGKCPQYDITREGCKPRSFNRYTRNFNI